MKTALLVGRFQPFHLGHLDAIKRIISENNKLIILIGSKQYSRTEKNPFTFEERKEMIEIVLKEENIEAEIYGLDDLNDNELWVDYVKKNLPDFNVVYSSNSLVERLFTEKRIIVEKIDFSIKISGEEIRNLMKKGEEWKKFVHPLVIEIITSS